MATQTLKMGGKKFVLIPKGEYDRMRLELGRYARQDRGDIAEARRRSKEVSVPLSEARKRLGF